MNKPRTIDGMDHFEFVVSGKQFDIAISQELIEKSPTYAVYCAVKETVQAFKESGLIEVNPNETV